MGHSQVNLWVGSGHRSSSDLVPSPGWLKLIFWQIDLLVHYTPIDRLIDWLSEVTLLMLWIYLRLLLGSWATLQLVETENMHVETDSDELNSVASRVVLQNYSALFKIPQCAVKFCRSRKITGPIHHCTECGGVVVRASDLQPRGNVTTLGKLFTHMCLCSPSSRNWYRRKPGAKQAFHATH